MKFLRLLTIALVALSMTSCTAYHDITIQEEAKAEISDSVRVVGIVNNITSSNGNKVQSAKLEREQEARNEEASGMATNGAFNSVLAQKRGAIVLSNDSIRDNNLGLDWVVLDSISQADSVDILVELTDFDATILMGTAVISVITNQPGTQKLKGSLGVNIFDVTNHKLIGEYKVENEIDIPFSGNLLDVDNDVRRKREAFQLVGYNLGYAGSELMRSHQVNVKRMYYVAGSPSVKAAKKMMQRKNWAAAEVILLKNVDDGKTGPRGRGLYNLAVIKEAQGDLDKAIEYCERSAFECMNNSAKLYLDKLELRKGIVE